jgi:hypothetical protein
MASKRACADCGRIYFDDGYTLCPQCESDSLRPGQRCYHPSHLPDAPARIWRLRRQYQANLAAGRPQFEGIDTDSLSAPQAPAGADDGPC